MGMNLRYSPLEYSKERGFDFGNANVANMGNNCVHYTFYVSSQHGSDSNSGFGINDAKKTIQAAVAIANSPDYVKFNSDIMILQGLYLENVEITRAASGLDYVAMLWTAGGTNLGYIGRLRLIGVGHVWLGTPNVAKPAIYVGRPSVEIHDFTTIKVLTVVNSYPITKTNWTDGDGGTSVHMKMPVVLFSDDYNNDTLLYGAANSCGIYNCKINGGTGAGGILNNGGNWIDVVGCTLEYCHEYGVAEVGSSKGFPAELKVYDSRFYQLYSGSFIVHGQCYYMHVDNCRFFDENPGGEATGGVLNRQTSNSNSNSCWITNCTVHAEDDLEGNNTGWDACGIVSAVEGGALASDDITGDHWTNAAAT